MGLFGYQILSSDRDIWKLLMPLHDEATRVPEVPLVWCWRIIFSLILSLILKISASTFKNFRPTPSTSISFTFGSRSFYYYF
jgi:hypothetical protein